MTELHAGLRVRNALVGTGLEHKQDVWMTFRDGHIDALGTGNAPVPLPLADAQWAMPGLVDCHVHLSLDGGADVVAALEGVDAAALFDRTASAAAATLSWGVTTVRDLGSPGDVVLRRHGELVDSPTVVAAGAISSPRGHGCFLAAHADDQAGYRRAIDDIAALGGRWVKLFATGGVITDGTAPGAPQMSLDALRDAVAHAHGLGLRVSAHAHGLAGIENALDAGVDSVEHFSYLGAAGAQRLRGGRPPVLVSTLVATERFAATPLRHGSSPEAVAKIEAHAPHERAALRSAVTADVPLAVGTDAGTTFNPHGCGMQDQAELLHAAGLDALGVLRSLTVHGAELLHEPCGVLEVGRRADLLLLDTDPVEDLGSLRDVRGVITRGHPVGALR